MHSGLEVPRCPPVSAWSWSPRAKDLWTFIVLHVHLTLQSAFSFFELNWVCRLHQPLMSSIALGPLSFTEKGGFQEAFSGLTYIHYSSSSYHNSNVSSISYDKGNFYDKDGVVSE